MKTTGKLLLGGLAVALIGITTFFFVIKAKASDMVEIRQIDKQDRTRIEKTYDLDDFQHIEIVGGWKIVLTQSETYSIRVHMPQYLEEMTTIRTNNGTLLLSIRPETQFNVEAYPATAEISLPQLTGIQSRGGSKLDISGFATDSLRIRSDGATSIRGDDNTVTSLFLNTTGASDINFKNSKITNADVQITGAGSIRLTMAGGRLTGSVAGASSVVYYGTVSQENIKTGGIASITHR